MKKETDPNSKARLHGILGQFYAIKGDTKMALKEIEQGLALAREPETILLLERRKARVFSERGEARYALALTECRSFPLASQLGRESLAGTLFDAGWFLQLLGRFDSAAEKYRQCLGSTCDKELRLHASTNLAAIHSEKGDFDAVERFLEMSDDSGGRNVQGMRRILKGRCLASRGDFLGAASSQKRAIDLWSHRGPADRALAVLELAKYQLGAVSLQDALQSLEATSKLAFELEDAQEGIAAAVLMEVFRKRHAISTAAELGHYLAALKKGLNPEDQPHRKRGRSRRRPRRRR